MEKGLRFYYDEEGDVLDVSVGAPEKAITKEVEEKLKKFRQTCDQ